nr:hypothetical protein [Streptomyces sp. TSRI0107]
MNALAASVTVQPGFWCECWTQDLNNPEEEPVLHGSTGAYSPARADRWIAIALRTISSALDADASDQAWEWLRDSRIDTRRALLRNEPCSVTITNGPTRVTWAVRPVLFLPLATCQCP